jgi:hypothetical protein
MALDATLLHSQPSTFDAEEPLLSLVRLEPLPSHAARRHALA